MAILRPIIREMIGRGVAFGRLESRLREMFVRLADSEFSLPNRQQTDSRISVLTGINRKEVRRIRHSPIRQVEPKSFERNLGADIVGRWTTDPRTTDGNGRAMPLPFRSRSGMSFVRLVRETTTDLRPRAILDELVRTGVAAVEPSGDVRLNSDAYVPSKGMPEKLAMLSHDPAELVTTMLRNIFGRVEDPHLQQRVAYDNLGAEGIEKVRSQLRRRTERFLNDIDRLVARFDRDRSSEAPGGDRRYVSLGVYYYESEGGSDSTGSSKGEVHAVPAGAANPDAGSVQPARRLRRRRA